MGAGRLLPILYAPHTLPEDEPSQRHMSPPTHWSGWRRRETLASRYTLPLDLKPSNFVLQGDGYVRMVDSCFEPFTFPQWTAYWNRHYMLLKTLLTDLIH